MKNGFIFFIAVLHVFVVNSQSWQHVSVLNTSGIVSDVYDFKLDAFGTRWFATHDGIGFQINQSDWYHINYDSSYMPFTVFEMNIKSDQSIYLGTSVGLMKYDGQKWQRWTKQDGLLSDTVTQILFDYSDRVWLSGTKGITCMDGSNFINYDTIRPLPFYNGTSSYFWDRQKPMALNSANELFVISSTYLHKFNGVQWTSVSWLDNQSLGDQRAIEDPTLVRLTFDALDSLWLEIHYYGSNGWSGGITPTIGKIIDGEFFGEQGTSRYAYNYVIGSDKKVWTKRIAEDKIELESDGSIIILKKSEEFDVNNTELFFFSENEIWARYETWDNVTKVWHYQDEIVASTKDKLRAEQTNLAYPVPAAAFVTFSVDFTGEAIRLIHHTGAAFDRQVDSANRIDLSGLPAGMYSLLVKGNLIKVLKL